MSTTAVKAITIATQDHMAKRQGGYASHPRQTTVKEAGKQRTMDLYHTLHQANVTSIQPGNQYKDETKARGWQGPSITPVIQSITPSLSRSESFAPPPT